jgi:hypothetical protein
MAMRISLPNASGSGLLHHLSHKSNLQDLDYPPQRIDLFVCASKPDIPPDPRWRVPMKNLILAAVAALSLTAAMVPVANAASTVGGDKAATLMQQTGSYGE